jgi:hypothetical protein
MRAQSPLAAERWKRIQIVALMALEHAEKLGGTSHLATLVNALPQQISERIGLWVATFSPLAIVRHQGRSTVLLRKKKDPAYKPFDSKSAAATPIFQIEAALNPVGEQIARGMLAKEFKGKPIKQCIRIIQRWFSENAASMRLDDQVEHQNFSRLNEGMSLRTHTELLEIYAKCVEELTSDGQNTAAATKLRESVFSEWRRRHDESLIDEYFAWPSTEAPTGLGRMGAIASPAEGILSAFGYHVGETNGRPDRVRRLLLDDIFSVHLPPINSRAYMSEWGSPTSAGRLRKIADTLASLTRNEKRRGLEFAPKQREMDLEYLHQTYYLGKFGFGWTEI